MFRAAESWFPVARHCPWDPGHHPLFVNGFAPARAPAGGIDWRIGAPVKRGVRRIQSADSPGVVPPLRILRLTPHFFREGQWPVVYDPVGGLQTQVWRLTMNLADKRTSQTVLTSHIPGSPRLATPHPSVEVRSVGFPVPALLAGMLLNFAWFVGVLPHLLSKRRRYDTVHIHFNHSVWCRALAIVARARGFPVVVSLNTALWGGLRDALHLKGTSFDVTRHPERWALRSADSVIALTEIDAAAKMADLGIDRYRLTVIPDGIDVQEFGPSPEAADLVEFRLRHAVPHNRPVVVYVGRISPEKGWQDIVACVAALSAAGVFTLVCGDGPSRPRLQAALDALDRPDDWRITGFLDPQDVRRALGIARVLILPSRREAFGSVLLEAMACSVPAIAYAVGGIAEVAGVPPAVKLIDPADRSAFVAAVVRLVNDPAEARALSRLGRERVRQFAIEGSAAATRQIYEGLAGKGRPAPHVAPS